MLRCNLMQFFKRIKHQWKLNNLVKDIIRRENWSTQWSHNQLKNLTASLSKDGKWLALGLPFYNYHTYSDCGRVFLYAIDDRQWRLMGSFISPETTDDVEFGRKIAISDDGNLIVCSALNMKGYTVSFVIFTESKTVKFLYFYRNAILKSMRFDKPYEVTVKTNQKTHYHDLTELYNTHCTEFALREV